MRVSYVSKMSFLVCLLILACAASLAGAEVSIVELAKSLELTLEWDPFRRMGVLHDGIDRLAFSVASRNIVKNYQRVVASNAVGYQNGRLVLSEEGAAAVRETFAAKRPAGDAFVAAIVIDPGHGGKDPGASHSHLVDGEKITLVEKDIVLGVSKDLYSMLSERYPAREVVITRDEDVFLQLEERVEIANAIEIDPAREIMVFVSIHANASLRPGAYGYELWYLPPEYGRTGLVTSDEVGDSATNVIPLLNLMRDDEYTSESIRLAESILESFDAAVGDVSRNLGLKEESWFVVRNAKMPSILVELGFLTNFDEAIRMNDADYLRSLTVGLYNGITDYIDDFEQRYRIVR